MATLLRITGYPLLIFGSILFLLGFFLFVLGFLVQKQNILALVITTELADMVWQDWFFAFRAGGKLPVFESEMCCAFALGLFCSSFGRETHKFFFSVNLLRVSII